MAMHADNTECPYPSIHERCDSPACYTLLDTIPSDDTTYGDDRQKDEAP